MVTHPLFPFARDAFIVDLFAGGGGASEGIRRALGRCPDVAVNHDADAIAMHAVNHPDTRHYREDVFAVDPVHACGGKQPDLMWASPDCKHFSKAKGGKPLSKKIRGLAWVVLRWAAKVRPRVICMENVVEFLTWGPLTRRGRVKKKRKGETYRRWESQLTALGYTIEWRKLKCHHYGSPTTRERFVLIATLDGAPVWPEPTHGPGLIPYLGTGDHVIDWSIPCPSIFLTPAEVRELGLKCRRPLAAKTMARIAAGVKKYILDHPDPYRAPDGAVACLIQSGYGERKGQAPRTLDIREPLGTVVAGGSKHAVVTAWVAKHYGGVVGHDARAPASTVTTRGGSGPVSVVLDGPEDRSREVYAFLSSYYGESVGRDLREPCPTVTTRDRFAVVVVEIDGVEHVITDIGMRMFTPRENANAQGVGPEYALWGTRTAQQARVGNMVPPALAQAVVAANLPNLAELAAK